MTSDSGSIWWAIVGIIGVVILGVLFFFSIAILFEIPELVRSLKLSRLAKRYNLDFIRAKKGWCRGWISLDVGEKNFIFGTLGSIQVKYSDLNLVQNNLAMFFDPAIAEADNKLSRSYISGSLTKKVSRLNEVVYSRFSENALANLFNKIEIGQIASDAALGKSLEKKDFSKHLMRNYKAGSWVAAFLLLLSSAVTAIIDPGFSTSSFVLLILFNLCVNLPIFVWTSNAYGKRFTPDDINKPPQMNNFLDDKIKFN